MRALADDADRYAAEILEKRITVLDLLSRYPSCQLTFASYLQMLAPLTPRQYSISSSPRWSADHATLTLAVLSAPAYSGDGVYEGAASTYLAHARPGSKVAVTVRGDIQEVADENDTFRHHSGDGVGAGVGSQHGTILRPTRARQENRRHLGG